MANKFLTHDHIDTLLKLSESQNKTKQTIWHDCGEKICKEEWVIRLEEDKRGEGLK